MFDYVYTDYDLDCMAGKWSDNGVGIFFKDNRNISTYGTIIDYSDLVSIGLDIYSNPYNWETSESFAPNASIAYSKLFSNSDFVSAYSTINASTSTPWKNFNNGIFGYNIRLNYADDSGATQLVNGSKIILDLNFPLTVYGGTSYSYQPAYARGAYYKQYTGSGYNYLRDDVNALNILDSNFGYPFSGPKSFFGNTVSVVANYGDGVTETLATYDNVDELAGTFALNDDTEFLSVEVNYYFNDSTISYYEDNLDPVQRIWLTYGFYGFDVSGTVEVDDSGINTGLLKGIVEWLKGILNAILELPQNIANKVKDVIVSLFVPTSDGLSASFDGLKNMAESKLGFVYTGFSMVYDLLNSIVTGVVEPMETLTLPRLVIPFRHIDGGEFVLWEEMTFDIVPNGMEVLQNLCKLVTSLVLVWLTMRRCLNYFKDFFSKE